MNVSMLNVSFFHEEAFNKNKPLLIYGYDLACLRSLPSIFSAGLKVDAIIDSNPINCGTEICGITIMPIDTISQFPADANVFIPSIQGKYTITKMFKDLGFHNFFYNLKLEMVMYDSVIKKNDEYRSIIDDNKSEINFARSLFREQRSRDIFDARLNMYYKCDFSALEGLYTPRNYFPIDILRLTQHEVYVDVGVHNGGSVFEFISTVNGGYNSIYAFDAEELCFEMSNMVFLQSGRKNISVHRYAICDYVGKVRFNNLGCRFAAMGGRIDSSGQAEVPCTSLDAFFQNNEEKPTLIKMDIEGAEMDALVGAKKLIKKHMPKFAICVYHKMEHLWEVPNKIHEMQPGRYGYYLRHSGSYYDTVCYAAPEVE